jgi:hypothetical protein
MANPNPSRNQPLAPRVRAQPTVQDVGVIMPSITDVPDVKEEELRVWLNTLYDVTTYSDEDIKMLWDNFSYKGFNRNDVLKQLFQRLRDKKLIVELVVAGALRGPQAASRLKLSNGKTAIDLGIPASGGQGSKALTMNKIISATSDLAAYFLKKMNAPKRIDVDLPGWLQFPSAGSIKLPTNLREKHLEFSKKFSTLIGGAFQEQIYQQMVNNAYLDEKLHLFV